MYDAISKDSCMLQWLINIYHPQDWYASLHRWSVLELSCSQKSTSYHSVCMWFRQNLYLLSVEGLGKDFDLNHRQLFIFNHGYNKWPAKIRYSIQKVQLLYSLIYKFQWSLLSGLCVIAQTGLKAGNCWKWPDFCFPKQDSLDNLKKR